METIPIASVSSNVTQTSSSQLADLIYSRTMEIFEGKANEVALLYLLLLIVPVYGMYRYNKSYINLPYVGIPSGPFGSWRAGYNFLASSGDIIREGYQKYAPEGRAYVVSTLPRYMVFLTDPAQIAELGHVSDTEIGFYEALNEKNHHYMLAEPSLGDYINTYHVDIIRQQLTPRMASVLPEIRAEGNLAWREHLKIGDDWTRVKIWDVVPEVVSRSANRCFVGVPLCRDRKFLDIMRDYAIKVNEANFYVDLAPWFLQRAVAWYHLWRYRLPEQALEILGPVFDERKRRQQECDEAEWQAEKPNDAIQWILDAAAKKSKDQQTNKQLTWRMLWFNFAAIHTTSMSTMHALYDLTANPEYIAPLREEIISTLDAHGGYTKEALNSMHKLDSCLKESQRYNTVVSVVMSRVTMRPYTFKSGKIPLTLPKGTFITVPASSAHVSEEIYGADALEWKGFRFAEIREREGDKESSAKHQAAATNSNYLAFSHGRHACTGRFFAIYQLKMLLIYVLLRYDIRLPTSLNGKRPENVYDAGRRSADLNGEIEFREREAWKELKVRWGDFDQEED